MTRETLNFKSSIERTGIAYLTFYNNQGEQFFVGNVDRLVTKDGRVKMAWKLREHPHISNFDKAMIHNVNTVLWTDEVSPVRFDSKPGRGAKYHLEFDL
jgi:hypothetical protein